ncbi:two-component system response regulator [Leptolyngbya sp. BL0902]|uniref:response regulator n=1 Tax=Leptolyngbya sp. BL0902 TaxID=1115757 RepID=UPI0018E880E5|nr:response regulator [Leptolyngbya sp. BL0902]QQE63517.1 two-component system response regulator [Leptolyngbya sp. BL0902]
MAKHILVIDDEADIRDVVCLSLEEFGGWHTAGAHSGHAGLELAQQYPWDAIVLDVSMPDLDGVTVVENLRANPATSHIPVILLTARVLPSDQARFGQLGVAGVIAKPFDPLQVWQQVATIAGWDT